MKDRDLGNDLMDLSPLKLGVVSESGAHFWALSFFICKLAQESLALRTPVLPGLQTLWKGRVGRDQGLHTLSAESGMLL